jgi:amino acid permease
MPYTIELLMGKDNKPDFTKGLNPDWSKGKHLPNWIGNTNQGQIVWALLFSFCLLFPISLPRELKALRFSSFMSFGISIFVVFSVFFCSFREKKIDGDGKYDFSERFSAAYNEPDITVAGIFNSLPLIIFAYMYQPNIPAIYHELKAKNMGNINKVLSLGTLMASVAYILTGMFGYVTFAKRLNVDQIMNV